MLETQRMLDYDDVRVTLHDDYVSYTQEVTDPDLTFKWGTLTSSLPLIVYYDDPDGSSKMEEVCAAHGLLTAGAKGSMVPLASDTCSGAYALHEDFDPLRAENLARLKGSDKRLLVNCSLSSRHAIALASELKVASAVLFGPTQGDVTLRYESIGMAVPRISLIQKVVGKVDVPVVATAGSVTDVVKALVAGADATLIHFGGPFKEDEDLDFFVRSVADIMRANLTELCRSAGAKRACDLWYRCKLVPK